MLLAANLKINKIRIHVILFIEPINNPIWKKLFSTNEYYNGGENEIENRNAGTYQDFVDQGTITLHFLDTDHYAQ